MKSLIAAENLSQFSASPAEAGVWFAVSATEVVRIQDGQITDRAVMLNRGPARFAATDGSFWISGGHGIAAYEPGKGFRYSMLPDGIHIRQISGDAENVWVLVGSTVWRRPLR